MRHHFALENERATVLRICRLVDGMPLAIELAAAWLRSLACAEIAAELQRGLEILHSDQLGIPDRHRAMRVVFDHSWQLLNQDERELLQALSVFQGGFLREAAEQVAGATPALLAALTDKSMLRMTAEGRYTIHELQRQYAAERLAASPAHEVAIRNRHATYYLHFIDRPVKRYLDTSSQHLRTAIEAEIGNVLSAWYWAVDHDRLDDLLGAMDGIYWFSWLSTHHTEGERAFRYAIEALRRGPADVGRRIVYANALANHGIMGIWMGHDAASKAELEEGIALLRELPGGRRYLGFAVGGLAWYKHTKAEVTEAKTLFLEAAELNQAAEQYEAQAWNYCMLGHAARRQSAYAEHQQWFEKALTLARAIEDQRTIAHALADLAHLAIWKGEYLLARRYLEESLSAAQTNGIRAFTVEALASLGDLAALTGELDRAAEYLEACVAAARLDGKEPIIVTSLGRLAQVRAAQQEYGAAAELYQEAMSLRPQNRNDHQIDLMAGIGNLALQTQDYAAARRSYAESLALARKGGDGFERVRALVGLGMAALRQSELADGRRYLLDALHEAERIGFAPTLLDSITAVAELFAAEGDLVYAAQLARLVADHDAAGAATRVHARTILAQTAPHL